MHTYLLVTTPIILLISRHNQLHSSPTLFIPYFRVWVWCEPVSMSNCVSRFLAMLKFFVCLFVCFPSPNWTGSFLPNVWDLSPLTPFFLFLFSPPFLPFFSFFSFLFFLFLYCFITNIVTGDQSPSSPASRWPGANYGNRTLGVCLTTFLTGHHPLLYCTSVGCITHTSILSKHSNWAGLQHADSCAELLYFM